MPAVSSSMISWIEYDEKVQELAITFASGRTCIYSGVPPHVYERFLESSSKGKFFNQFIKDRYPFRG